MTTASILAVDDDPVNLHIIELTFEEGDYQLHFARNGAAALALLQDEGTRVDLVILDRMMPGMDGMEVLRQIKSTPRLKHTPVVMQTAAATPEQVAEGLRCGAHYYLTKPYAPSALRSIVQAALEDMSRQSEVLARTHQLLDGVRLVHTAAFVLRTHAEATEIATLLAATCPDANTTLIGLSEMMYNAIEHGNLELGYQEKKLLKTEHRWEEEIARRADLVAYRDRRVQVSFVRTATELTFRIVDEGKGFAWERYLELDPARLFDPNGRGIALAKALSFSSLHFDGCGNIAVATVAIPAAA